jgi:hypothetical protein
MIRAFNSDADLAGHRLSGCARNQNVASVDSMAAQLVPDDYSVMKKGSVTSRLGKVAKATL